MPGVGVRTDARLLVNVASRAFASADGLAAYAGGAGNPPLWIVDPRRTAVQTRKQTAQKGRCSCWPSRRCSTSSPGRITHAFGFDGTETSVQTHLGSRCPLPKRQGRLPLNLRALLDFATPRLRARLQKAAAALASNHISVSTKRARKKRAIEHPARRVQIASRSLTQPPARSALTGRIASVLQNQGMHEASAVQIDYRRERDSPVSVRTQSPRAGS